MKFSYPMLLEFVETSLGPEQVGGLLTMAGFELEGIEEIEGESVLDIKVVSNRGDGLSVFGLAREVLAKDAQARPAELYLRAAARFRVDERANKLTAMKSEIEFPHSTSVAIETPACTRYACRMFENVRNGQSPAWLQKRIRQAGWRPISLLVDLSNYVMLELGQPLHAFDFEKLRGGRIVVREAQSDEQLTTLDGNEHELQPGQMMICDAQRPVAAAGIMGGLETEVDANTKIMLLESAHFVSTSVRRTRKQLGLSTEASYRFERSVDPEGVAAALDRFAELFAGCNSGDAIPGIIDEYPAPPSARFLAVRLSRANRLLGVEVMPLEAAGYLERLGFSVEGEGEPFTVTAPSWRPDVLREDDVIEEIGRVHGYDKIPETPLHGTTLQGGVFDFEAFVDRVREAAVRAGFVQTISYSLTGPHPLDEPGKPLLRIKQVDDPRMSCLCNSLLPALADNALRNGARNLHLFEIAPVFSEKAERRSLALWSQGNLSEPFRAGESTPQADFFSLKGALTLVFEQADATVAPGWTAPEEPDPRFHPTRQARFGDAGISGQIHPEIAERLGVPADTIMASLDVELLFGSRVDRKRWKPVSRNPAIRRDIAVLVSKEIGYARIEKAIETACGEVLEKQWLFDVYEGQGMPEGHHSLAIALQLRKMGENLTDAEANQVRDRAVAALESLGGKQR